LAGFTSELELAQLPVVEIEALPGQPSLIHADADAFAVTQNLSAVKALVLAGLGVGQLLPFMLNEHERAGLVCAEHLQHDPDCGVYAVHSFRTLSEQETKIHQDLVARVSRQLSDSKGTA
jgi:DNA-binding transcriptional LysR family regulator